MTRHSAIGACEDGGTEKIDFTITGVSNQHNLNVRNQKAYEMFIDAVQVAHKYNFETSARLISMSDMLSYLPEVDKELTAAGVDIREARVSEYRPIPTLRRLEKLRPTLEEITPYIEMLRHKFNDNGDDF